MLGKNEFVKIMKESVGITNRMNSLQKIEKFNLVGIKRRNIIFRGLIDQREYFDAILFFANSILFEEVISEIIGQEICHDGIEWFEANINRRELAISIGCGNTAYSKGRSGFQYFFDKATKHNKAVALKNEKNSRQLKYHITTCEKNLLNEMGEKPEIIEELEKGFTTMDKILDYAKTLPNRSNNFRWSSPSVKSTVSKRINGCSKPPYIQPKLPLICVLGIIEPEQAYENKLALRPQKSRLFSTKGLSKYVIGWEMQNESLEKTVKTSLYSRCQVIDWGERDVMKLISDEVQHIRFGVDHRKTPAGGFDSKAELQDQLGINQGQAAKVLNGSDVMQASIDKRIKRIFIAGAHYTKDEIGKYTGLTKSAVAQRIKKHLGKENEYSLIFAKKHQIKNSENLGKASRNGLGLFYIVDYIHPSIAEELVKFGITGKESTNKRLVDHAGSRWVDRLIISGPSQLIEELENHLKVRRIYCKLKQPVVDYTLNNKCRALSGYQEILLRSEFQHHFKGLIDNPIAFCYRKLSIFAKKNKFDMRSLKVTYQS